MYALPTLYKARNLPLKRPVCAICVDRTRGRTEEVRLGYRATVWLCPGHAAQAFQTRRNGRDFVRMLMGYGRRTGASRPHGTAPSMPTWPNFARMQSGAGGSYAWPELRRRLEARYAAGAAPLDPSQLGDRPCQRWHAQRRWLSRPP